MHYYILKTGCIFLILMVLQCSQEVSSPIHPVLRLETATINDTTQLMISTTTSDQFSMYKILNDTCKLMLTYTAMIDGEPTVITDSVAVLIDPSASQSGIFKGSWVVPDSLRALDELKIYGCVYDEMSHSACAPLTIPKFVSPAN